MMINMFYGVPGLFRHCCSFPRPEGRNFDGGRFRRSGCDQWPPPSRSVTNNTNLTCFKHYLKTYIYTKRKAKYSENKNENLYFSHFFTFVLDTFALNCIILHQKQNWKNRTSPPLPPKPDAVSVVTFYHIIWGLYAYVVHRTIIYTFSQCIQVTKIA